LQLHSNSSQNCALKLPKSMKILIILVHCLTFLHLFARFS